MEAERHGAHAEAAGADEWENHEDMEWEFEENFHQYWLYCQTDQIGE